MILFLSRAEQNLKLEEVSRMSSRHCARLPGEAYLHSFEVHKLGFKLYSSCWAAINLPYLLISQPSPRLIVCILPPQVKLGTASFGDK